MLARWWAGRQRGGEAYLVADFGGGGGDFDARVDVFGHVGSGG